MSGLIEKIRVFYKNKGLDLDMIMDNDLNNLPDLGSLLDIKIAAQRVSTAIKKGELIALYGDYDADGTTSIALFWHFLDMIGHKNVKTYQPNRFIEGYGLHKDSIDRAIDDKCSLMITFDCGIMNQEEAEYAKITGLDLIITDHHNDGSLDKPIALAVVNPKRQDQPDSELKSLAGVGVSFALALAVKKEMGVETSIYPLLQFLSIGTIGDLVPLNSMNIKLVRHGFSQFRNSQFEAIKKIYSICPNGRMTGEFIGFRVAPLINSKGRLGSAEDALKFLISKSEEEANELFQKLVQSNEERKKIQRQGTSLAKKIIDEDPGIKDGEVIVVYCPGVSQGVVGLISSQITRLHQKPSIILTEDSKDPNILKGSARSIGDFDLYGFLSKLDFKFISFGGHKKASGLALKSKDLDLFLSTVKESSKGLVIRYDQEDHIEIDASDVSFEVADALYSLEPFGEGNRKPKISVKLTPQRISILKGEHLKIDVKEFKGSLMLFNYKDDLPHYKGLGEAEISFDLVGVLCEFVVNIGKGEWMGNPKLDIFIEKITKIRKV